METIAEQSYVVLDIPSPVADRVLEIRREHRDDFRAALPVEVTLAGSGGVGCFTPGQPAAPVFDALDRIASETPPFATSLSEVERFPDTDIFVFRFGDESGLRRLQERIAGSGIAFDPTPYPFVPHVTIRSRSPVTDEDAASMLAERIPDEFVLDSLSVYQLERDPAGAIPVICRLSRRLRLHGQR